MTVKEIREFLYDMLDSFFTGAKVVWAEQVMTRPSPPYLLVKLSDIDRKVFPMDDGTDRYYESTLIMTLNLYTKGESQTAQSGYLVNSENTAVSDMLDFCDFIDSEIELDALASKNIAIMRNARVRDLSALEHDTKYRYRSQAEFTVTFADTVNGAYAGIEKIYPNASGGGTAMMQKEQDIIKTVDVEDDFKT